MPPRLDHVSQPMRMALASLDLPSRSHGDDVRDGLVYVALDAHEERRAVAREDPDVGNGPFVIRVGPLAQCRALARRLRVARQLPEPPTARREILLETGEDAGFGVGRRV